MPKSIQELSDLWKDAKPETKLDYLFIAVCHVNEKLDESTLACVCRLQSCSGALSLRVEDYKKTFITRTQAKIGAIVMLLVIAAFSVGAGLVTFNEAVSLLKP